MIRFWWVRHAPTHAKALIGWTDLAADLSDSARLARVDAALPGDGVLLSSDLRRARETAEAFPTPRTRSAPNPAFREIHLGTWENRPFPEVEHDPRLRPFFEKPGHRAAPGGESWDDLSARVDAAVDALCVAPPATDIIVVTHLGVIARQLQRALGLSAYDALGHTLDPLGITEVHWTGAWQVARINHAP